jgi:tRNA dimethylallyltransferase
LFQAMSAELPQNWFFLVGPTASGKSQLAADVAERLDAEIVSADAFQIYHGLPLLTAQPDEATLRQVEHHLLDAFPLTVEMSAAKFRELALNALAEIASRGKRALVVGGSGLYVKALTHGLAPLPPIDEALRARLNALSLEELNDRLAAVDPRRAETIDRKNKRRVVRALEIFAQTSQPASAQRAEWQEPKPTAAGVFVFRERAELYQRIDARVEEMFQNGVVEEVAQVKEVSDTAAKTLGFAEILSLLSGKISQRDCVAAIQQATRRYAKRQLTWFRQQTNFEPLNLSSLKDHEAAVDWILQKAERSFAAAEE